MSWGTSEWGTSPWGGSEDAPSPPGSTRASWVDAALDDEIGINWVGPHALDVEWEGYSTRPTRTDADVVVTSTAELYAELGTTNQTIWLDEDTTFNVDGEGGAQNIATGVTLASDGARIQASDPKRPVFYLSDDDVRITGIRFEGEEPNPDMSNPPSGASITSRAIVIQAQGVEVDNCEVYGFTDSGIYVGWNDNNPPQHIEPSVHHNIVRDCLYAGLGYGIVVYSGNPQLEYDYINGCRHGVAAGGRDACEYELRNSVHGGETLVFQAEMHEHPDVAGSSGIGATVEYNEFRAIDRPNGNTARAYAQRGTPQDLTRFDNNWTWNPDGVDPNNPGASSTALSQTNHGSSDWVNVEWSSNHHGSTEPADPTVGVQEPGALGAPTEQYTLNVTLTDQDGNTIAGTIDIHRLNGDTDAPTSPTAPLSVFAEDELSGNRIDGADVTVERVDEPLAGDPTGPWTGVTGSSSVAAGGYDFGELPQGYYQITVEHEDYNTGTYDEELWRNAGEESYQAMYLDESGRLPIIYLESAGGPDYEYEVSASDGPSAINSALNSTSDGGAVLVSGDGSYTWSQSVEVPDNTVLDVENTVSVTVPSSHSITSYSPGSRDVYALITNANRSSAQNVHIRGGTYDMSNMSEQAGYAGIWLHEASDSTIENVEINGSGYQIQDNRTYRGFGLTMTACTDCEIIDSEAYDSAYDDIGVRGGNLRCRVVRSGGSGATSGTIQSARWGNWDLTGYPRQTEYVECWGRRIYCHDGRDTVWDGCQSDYRLQTIGTNNPTIRNSTDFQGTVLIYTYDSGTSEALIEDMEFASGGASDAIQIGPNGGQDIGHVTIDNCYADRSTWIHFNDYSSSAVVDTVEVTDCELYGSELISKDSGVDVGTLIFRGCEIHDFSTGIVGSYDNIVVEDCDVYGMSSSDLIDASGSVSTSGNTYH